MQMSRFWFFPHDALRTVSNTACGYIVPACDWRRGQKSKPQEFKEASFCNNLKNPPISGGRAWCTVWSPGGLKRNWPLPGFNNFLLLFCVVCKHNSTVLSHPDLFSKRFIFLIKLQDIENCKDRPNKIYFHPRMSIYCNSRSFQTRAREERQSVGRRWERA